MRLGRAGSAPLDLECFRTADPRACDLGELEANVVATGGEALWVAFIGRRADPSYPEDFSLLRP